MSNVTVQEALKAAIEALLYGTNTDEAVELCKAALSEIDKCEPVINLNILKYTEHGVIPDDFKGQASGYRAGWNDCLSSIQYMFSQPIEKCEPELYMAKNLHNKSYATSRSQAEARLFLLQSGLKVDGIESEVIPLCYCGTSPQPRDCEDWQYFDKAYKKATESSEPDDWMNAALLAQQVRRIQLNTKG